MRFLLLILILISSSATALARCDNGESVIRFAQHTGEETATLQRTLYNLRTAINLELQGKACVEMEVDDDRFSGFALLKALQSGEIQMAAPSYSALGRVLPDYRVFGLPFAFRDFYGLQRFLTISGKRLSEQLTKFDVLPIAFWSGQFIQIAAKKPVYVPRDISGLRVFRGRGSWVAPLIAELGAISATVPVEEINDAVKDGRIEVQMIGWEQLVKDKTALIHNGVTQTNMHYQGNQLIVSKTWWDGLSPELTKSLSGLIERVSRQSNLDNEQRTLNARRELMASGAIVRLLTRKQRQRWIFAFADIWSNFESRDMLQQLQKSDRRP